MRRRRNPIERRRARRPLMFPYLFVGALGFILTPFAMITLAGDFTFTPRGESGGWEFSGSSSTSSEDTLGSFLLHLWLVATVLPGAVGGFLLIRGYDLNRSSLRERGWGYRSERYPMARDRHHTFPFGGSRKKHVAKLAWGSVADRSAAIYTFWASHKYRYTVEKVELPVSLPSLMLVPANAYDKVMVSMGGQDIRVESEVFNERWRVMSPHPAAAHAFLHPRMMERLLAHDLEDMAISVDSGALLSWWPGLTPVEESLHNVEVLADIATLIPQSTFSQFGEPRDPSWGSHAPEAGPASAHRTQATPPAAPAAPAASQTVFLPE